jgi:thiamine biosynthesis lipoprotein
MRFFAGINVVISLLLSVVALSSCSPQDRYIEFSGFAQGGVYTVKMNLNGRDGMIRSRPQEIKDSVDAILGRVDASLSGYNKKSLLSRFNDGQKIVPDEMFLDIYEKAYDV